jgi:hypothetical protein
MSDSPYDIYLSYRRESGATEARLLQSSLQARGKQSFLDATETTAVPLLDLVTNIPNFLVTLSPGALDQCGDPQDWLRAEIGQALRTGSNIIPVLLPGFAFPAQLPEDIRVLTLLRSVEYNIRSFENMLAEIMTMTGPAQPLKLQYQQSAAPVAAAPPPAFVPPARSPASFNWMLAGLLFLAEFFPSLVTTIFEPPSLMLQLLGHSLLISMAIAVATTLILQRVPNPVAIAAFCGLTVLVANYALGVLFFNGFHIYAFGLVSFLYGALVPGSIAVARLPRVPRWMLFVAPLAGALIYTILELVARVPGSDNIWQLLTRSLTPLLMGAAFFFAIKRDQNENRV